MTIPRTSTLRGATMAVAAIFLFHLTGATQESTAQVPSSSDTPIRELQDQVHQLQALIEQMRAENAESRAEMHQMRQDLQATRALLEKTGSPVGTGDTSQVTAEDTPHTEATPQPALEERVQKLEESTSLIGSKVDEQYQTKVETASKYRARLHGIVLMNAFRNVGASDNLDFPDYARPLSAALPAATVGASLRQSEIGLEIFGPNIFGARTSADVQLDFAGGFPATGNAVNFGVVRLQTASLRFDWDKTSVVAGQDALFISPLSPTSFASLSTPAFGLAGNLWGWTPQIRIEHRFAISDRQTITLQGGVLDNLDWEVPYNTFYRRAQAGEFAGQPAYAVRTSWSRPVREHPLSFGLAGYYGRQDWGWDRYVDAWAGMADWQIPILPRVALSGEFYRGRGIGGLGAGIGTSIVYGGDPSNPLTPIRGLNTAGGWSQLKVQVTPKVELNGAVSQDNAFTADIRGFASELNPWSILGRNRAALGNVVFRPRSDLILSAELRRLRTYPVFTNSSSMNQVNLSMGILF